MTTLSIITCVYNEENCIQPYVNAIVPVLDNMNVDYEIIFVNDGSKDNTLNKLKSLKIGKRITVISLSRNFGKEIALTAGLDYAHGDAVIPVDVDLQEPVELIPVFYEKWQQGYKSVIGVKRDRKYESVVKGVFTKIFYKLIQKISKVEIIPNSSDYRLLDRQVVEELRKMREGNRFMKGIYAYPGFKYTTIEYAVSYRTIDKTKWSPRSLWRLSLDGLFGFSGAAIKIWTYVGCVFLSVTLIYTVCIVAKALLFGVEVPGYVTTIILVFLFGSIQLIAIGILGEYISRIFEQVKNRPLYIVEDVIGC